MSDRQAARAWILNGIGPDLMHASLFPYRDDGIRFTNFACLYLDEPHFRVMTYYESTPSSVRMSEVDAAKIILDYKPNRDWKRFVREHKHTIQDWYPGKDDAALLALAEHETRICGYNVPLAMVVFGVTDFSENVAVLFTHAALRIDLALDRLREACRHLA